MKYTIIPKDCVGVDVEGMLVLIVRATRKVVQ